VDAEFQSEISVQNMATGAPQAPPENNQVYMGEKIVSFRQLLRRSVLARIETFDTQTTGNWLLDCIQGRFPLPYGFDPNGVDTADRLIATPGTAPFNAVYPILFNLLRPCYVGMRGSANWQFNLVGPRPLGRFSVRRETNENRSAALYKQVSTLATTTANVSSTLSQEILPGQTGRSLLNQNTQTGLAVQAPMYSRFRFLETEVSHIVTGSSAFDTVRDNIHVTAIFKPDAEALQNPKNYVLERYFAIGTDFTFFWFLNVPTMYLLESYPSPP